MSGPTVSWVLLLLLQITTIYCQGGDNTTHHDIDEVRRECESKIEALDTKWKIKQFIWQLSVLSLIQQLYSTTTGTITESPQQGIFRQYCNSVLEEQKLAGQEVQDIIDNLTQNIYNDLQDLGTAQTPVTSCNELNILKPNHTSGWYVIRNMLGQVSDQYCNMDLVGCGREGGWMRVANLDMTQPNQQCPPGFRNFTASGKRLCGRPEPAGCVSVKFPTNNVPYNRVSGRVIAYQDKTVDGQCPYTQGLVHTLEKAYIDGVSITHGSPRQHIWSFIASASESIINCRGCPCFAGFIGDRVPFIGDNVFCDSGTETWQGAIFYDADPLWDGQGCGPRSECCTFNNPPWFCAELDQHTSDDIELRLCADQNTDDEDIPIEIIEIYVQ